MQQIRLRGDHHRQFGGGWRAASIGLPASVFRSAVEVLEPSGTGRHDEAQAARDLLPALTDTLRAARQHLQIELENRAPGRVSKS